MSDMPETLWSYTLRHYADDRLARDCLELQDRWQLDIPMLFYCAWMGSRGLGLAHTDLAAVDRAVADWRAEVVMPLRAIRRRMKSGPQPAPTPETEALRSKVKAAELQAEQLEMRWLEMDHAQAGQPRDPAAAVTANLRLCFAQFAGRHPEDEAPLLSAIAAFGGSLG